VPGAKAGTQTGGSPAGTRLGWWISSGMPASIAGRAISWTAVVLAPLTRLLASTIRTARAPYRRSAMVVPVLAVAASSWGVLMGIAPLLQIRRMLRERSSRDVSLGYFMILLAGFLLWISYGIAAGNLVLVIPNSVALLVGVALVMVVLRLRRRSADNRSPRPGR
jgi:MtN3 and saliva related transmembrane protein